MSHVHVLGVNAYHGDASAVILRDGILVTAVEEERFNRVKHWAGLPTQAVRHCLDVAGIGLDEVDHLAISRDPGAHLHKKILFALGRRPGVDLVRARLANARRVRDVRASLANELGVDVDTVRAVVHGVEHHKCHMASAFFVSPFEEAACLSIDGFGDFVSTMWGVGRDTSITTLGSVPFPHSLGIFYTAVTQYLGFLRYGDEYKVMGLAPYGEPEFLDGFRQIVQTRPNGFRLDLDYFIHHVGGASMTWDGGEPELGRVYSDEFSRRFGPPRDPGAPLDPRHLNLAASLQALAEEVYFHVLTQLQEGTGLRRLCVAGGVAFNSVANGKIRKRTAFEEVYIQPAAGDAGTALGAALHVHHTELGQPRDFQMRHAFWGSECDEPALDRALSDARSALDAEGCRTRRFDEPDHLCRHVAARVADGAVVGWVQGRMEWGPRALGNRSILADPRRAEMKEILNQRIKRRESFRPFCPSVLEDAVSEYFEGAVPDPFMLSVYPVRPDKRDVVPAVTHVDGTGRLQSVGRDDSDLYWRLIAAFRDRTGVPMLLNTSFNENEPIVRTADEAVKCFVRTRMDVLVLGHRVVERPSEPAVEAQAVEQETRSGRVDM